MSCRPEPASISAVSMVSSAVAACPSASSAISAGREVDANGARNENPVVYCDGTGVPGHLFVDRPAEHMAALAGHRALPMQEKGAPRRPPGHASRLFVEHLDQFGDLRGAHVTGLDILVAVELPRHLRRLHVAVPVE